MKYDCYIYLIKGNTFFQSYQSGFSPETKTREKKNITATYLMILGWC